MLAAARAAIRAPRGVSQVIADTLTELILSGEIEPGTQLVQTDLTAWFEVSRVAVRDALATLVQRGLAEEGRRGSIHARRVSLESIGDIYEVRTVLAGQAARRVCLGASDAHLGRIRRHMEAQEELVREGGAREFATMDREFHDLVNAACDNELLRNYLRQLEFQHQQARSLALAQDPREDAATAWARASISRHRRMLDALLSRDPEEAERVMLACLNEGRERFLAALEPLLSPV